MATRSSRGDRGGGYVFKFVGTAALLVVGTLALVLYVLPERYVLSSGFREGSLNLPNPAIPFEPAPPLRVAAVPGLSRGPGGIFDVDPGPPFRGPSELFWEEVLPLLDEGRYADAIPLFTRYLSRYPNDVGARREYGITLAAAGYRDRALPLLEELLENDDPELRLLVARLLRDEGRVAEAGRHYRRLLDDRPADDALHVEWARALSWIEDYEGAEAVLRQALSRNPGSVILRAELARVLVYANRLDEARALLASLSEDDLRREGLLEIRNDVVAWLTPPPDTASAPALAPTLLEQALRAREADDVVEAHRLFRAALDETPGAAGTWAAYADFLQYELEDFEGALAALREVERLSDADPARQFRMARLEIWTGRSDDARARLEGLLRLLDSGGVADPAGDPTEPSPGRADVLATLGDLHRWDGDRLPAVRRYEAALEADSTHGGAHSGLDMIRGEVDRYLVEIERPGIGAIARGFADTDDFRRYDAGGEWTGLHDAWAWSTRSGLRRVEGLEVSGAPGDRQGVFAELEGARWWRWGTIRTAVHVGIQNVRANQADLGVGASVRFIGDSRRRTDVRFDHEPAFALTNTLQSIAENVRQDRLFVAHDRPVGSAWSLALSADVASLEHRGVAAAERNVRLQMGASAGRALSPSLSIGVGGRVLRYTRAAPAAATGPLYWDPHATVSVGPYLQLAKPVSTWWTVTGRAQPGVGYIDERGREAEVVPDLSGRLGLLREGERYRTSIEVFYGQGRFSAYRYYGLDLSFSARGWFGPGFGR